MVIPLKYLTKLSPPEYVILNVLAEMMLNEEDRTVAISQSMIVNTFNRTVAGMYHILGKLKSKGMLKSLGGRPARYTLTEKVWADVEKQIKKGGKHEVQSTLA